MDTYTQFSNRRFLCISLQKSPVELGRNEGRIIQELITPFNFFVCVWFWGFECEFMQNTPLMLTVSSTYFMSLVFLFWRHGCGSNSSLVFWGLICWVCLLWNIFYLLYQPDSSLGSEQSKLAHLFHLLLINSFLTCCRRNSQASTLKRFYLFSKTPAWQMCFLCSVPLKKEAEGSAHPFQSCDLVPATGEALRGNDGALGSGWGGSA